MGAGGECSIHVLDEVATGVAKSFSSNGRPCILCAGGRSVIDDGWWVKVNLERLNACERGEEKGGIHCCS